MATIRIDEIVCEPGSKARGFVPAAPRVDGSQLGIPVVVVNGRHDGPILLIDGGIHGDEQEGTLAILALAKALDPDRLHGALIGVPVMNVGGFEAMSRGNPRDGHTFDMNRIYPGRPAGFLTDRVAHVHQSAICALADMEVTIHSGGNICYLAETIFVGGGDARSFEMAKAMGPDWPIILDTPHPSGTPMASMLGRGKPAISIELGGAAACMPTDLHRIARAIKGALENLCRHYQMIDGEARYADRHWRGKQKVVQAGKSGVIDPLPDPPLKRPIARGDLLLRILDLIGEPVEELTAPCDGTLFGIRTYPSVTAGDWALFCAEATYEKG